MSSAADQTPSVHREGYSTDEGINLYAWKISAPGRQISAFSNPLSVLLHHFQTSIESLVHDFRTGSAKC
jgi:hypothetical protein